MENKKQRIDALRKKVDAPRLVGDEPDLLPFAWRTPPVVTGRKQSKVLRDMEQAEQLRTAPPDPKKR